MSKSIFYDAKLNFDPVHKVLSLFMEIGPDLVVQGPEDTEPVKPKSWRVMAVGTDREDLIKNIREIILDTSKEVFPMSLVNKKMSRFDMEGFLKKLDKKRIEENAFVSHFDITPYANVKNDKGELVVEKIFNDNDIEVIRLLLAPFNESKRLYTANEFGGPNGLKNRIAMKLVELSPGKHDAAETADIFVGNIGHRIIRNI